MSSAARGRAARSPARAAAPSERAPPSHSSCRGRRLHGQRVRLARAGMEQACIHPGGTWLPGAAWRALSGRRSRAGHAKEGLHVCMTRWGTARRSVPLGELGEEGVGIAPLIHALYDVSRHLHAADARLARPDLLEAIDDRLQALRDGSIVRIVGLRDRLKAAQRVNSCARALLRRFERRGDVVRHRARQARASTTREKSRERKRVCRSWPPRAWPHAQHTRYALA